MVLGNCADYSSDTVTTNSYRCGDPVTSVNSALNINQWQIVLYKLDSVNRFSKIRKTNNLERFFISPVNLLHNEFEIIVAVVFFQTQISPVRMAGPSSLAIHSWLYHRDFVGV